MNKVFIVMRSSRHTKNTAKPVVAYTGAEGEKMADEYVRIANMTSEDKYSVFPVELVGV